MAMVMTTRKKWKGKGEGLRDPASKKFKGRRLLVDLVGAKRLQVQAERRDFLRENVELLRGQW